MLRCVCSLPTAAAGEEVAVEVGTAEEEEEGGGVGSLAIEGEEEEGEKWVSYSTTAS